MKPRFTYVLEQDEDAQSPREDYDNFGTMVCWHGRYNLGDEQPKENAYSYKLSLACAKDPRLGERIERIEDKAAGDLYSIDYNSREFEERRQQCAHDCRLAIDKVLDKHYVMLTLFLYDHSGITMRTSPFSCPWDSGPVGFIYASYETIRKEFGVKRVTKAVRENAERLLRSEVETYDQYLTGDVWGYRILEINPESPDDQDTFEQIDSCWGFFGSEYCKEQAEEQVEWWENKTPRQEDIPFSDAESST